MHYRSNLQWEKNARCNAQQDKTIHKDTIPLQF